MKVWQFFVLLFVASVLSVWYTFNYAVEFSAFAVALAKVFIGMFLFYLFDVWALRDIETIQELKNGNIALSIFFLGYAILVAACVATA
ncbi:MAG: hypothetical protein R2834_06960 [Rhodothermales bacterium]